MEYRQSNLQNNKISVLEWINYDTASFGAVSGLFKESTMIRRISLTFLTASFVTIGFSQQLAFPGAEGYGKYATGGRGGRIIEVTNLLDLNRRGQTEEGSLRAALNTEGDDPITIVFKVSGIIELSGELKAGRSNMTIAGQTAPGDGICIKNESVKLSGDNMIIRYIRFRPGDELMGQASGLNIENSKNVIVDHCSMSWAIEENMGFYDNKYTTVQWCILSEGLYDSYHSKGPRGYGSQWGGQFASYHHNLLAHNKSRSPRINGSRAHDTLAVVDFRNNVIFNWGGSGAIYGGEEEIPGGKSETNFVNNYYVPGPVSEKYFARPTYVTEGNEVQGYGAWYFSGNIMQGVTGGINDDNWQGVEIIDVIGSADNIHSDVEFEVEKIPTESAADAYLSVLAEAGAILPVRDDVDNRITGEAKGTISVTGDGIVDSQTEIGGWPEYNSLESLPDSDGDGMHDEYELENSLDPEDPEDRNGVQESGYTNLEVYLNSIVGVTGVQEVVLGSGPTKSAFEIFPNPSGSTMHFNGLIGLESVQLYDLQGRLLKLKKIVETGNGFLELDDFSEGLYIVKAYFRDGSVVKRKIIKR